MEREQSETWGQNMTSKRSNFSLGRVKTNTSPTCALPYNPCLHFYAAFASSKHSGSISNQTWKLQNTNCVSWNQPFPTTELALKSSKRNVKEKLYSEDLVQHSIIIITIITVTEWKLKSKLKVYFLLLWEEGSLSTGRKLQSPANNQQCPPDSMVVCVSPDLPMEFTLPGLLLLLNKDWRLWGQDGRTVYMETTVPKSLLQLKKLSSSISKIQRVAMRLEDLIWNK